MKSTSDEKETKMWLDSQQELMNATEETTTVIPFDTNNSDTKEKCDYMYNINASLNNASCLDHAPQFTTEAQIRGLIVAFMAVLSLVGNTATIISIARQRTRFRSTVYVLIRHLSIADLFVTFACTVTESIWTYTVQWYGGNVLCKMMKYLQMFSLHVSTFILVLIGLDRYYAVRYPMRRSDINKYISYGIIIIWILSGIFSIPQAVVFHVVRGPFIEEFYQCVTYGMYSAKWQEHLYMSFGLTFMFILPLVILTVTYVSTFITLKKSEKVFKFERTTLGNTCPEVNRRRLMRKAKMRALKISVIIVLAFIICWTPYYILMIVSIFLEIDEKVIKQLQDIIFCFGMSNSLVNPIIYGAFHLCRCPGNKFSLKLTVIRSTRSVRSSAL